MRSAQSRTFTNAAAMVFVLSAGIAQADPQSARSGTEPSGQAGQKTFANVDTNADHHIDRKEGSASKNLSRKFDRLDINKDGQLSESEFAEFERQRSEPTVPPSKVQEIKDSAKPTKPEESWFTTPEHTPPGANEPSSDRK